MSKHEGIALSPLLFKAQLLCKEGSSKAALRMLIEIEDETIKYKASLVATKIALMEQVCIVFSNCKGDFHVIFRRLILTVVVNCSKRSYLGGIVMTPQTSQLQLRGCLTNTQASKSSMFVLYS